MEHYRQQPHGVTASGHVRLLSYHGFWLQYNNYNNSNYYYYYYYYYYYCYYYCHYNYKYYNNHSVCYRTMGFVIYTLVAGTLCVLGLAGNTVAYVVLGGDREMLPVAKFLLRSLAVADNFFLLVFLLNFSVAQLFS